jgi:Uma2 family endonuclease
MATTTHIPLSEYLETSYRPDREYVDDEVGERNVGKWEHARTLALLAASFGRHESQWGIIGCTSLRVPVSYNRVRVPDLVVLKAGPHPDVLTDPPLLVIEILSPDDNYSDTQERAQDYRAMGVETVWIIDPKTRIGRMCSGSKWVEAKRLEVAGTPMFVELDEIFSQINSRN